MVCFSLFYHSLCPSFLAFLFISSLLSSFSPCSFFFSLPLLAPVSCLDSSVNLMSALPARLIAVRQTDQSTGECESESEEQQKRIGADRKPKRKIKIRMENKFKKKELINKRITKVKTKLTGRTDTQEFALSFPHNPLPFTEQAITISQVEIKIPCGMCVCMYLCVCACVYSKR